MPKPKKKEEWKTVKNIGFSMSFSPTKGNNKYVEQMLKGVEDKQAKKAEKEAERAKKPLPDLTPRVCLVAFIDILGFGHEIETAKTKEDLEEAYKKVFLVQKEFQKVSAADNPEEQTEFNSNYGRRVIALSDAVVVAITSNCPAGEMMGNYDLLGLAVFELIEAQARCVANHGIFVRGGLSHGPFFFEDDILLSPALAKAYELESKYAKQPVIVVAEATRKALLGGQQKCHYAPGADPTPQYFAQHGKKKWRGQSLYFLDYMRVMIHEGHRGWVKEDYEDYCDANRKHDHVRAQAALERMSLKDAAYFLKCHRTRVEEAYLATDFEKVRNKYRWLMKYHNGSFRNDVELVRDEVIDLTKFVTQTHPPSQKDIKRKE